MKKYFITTISLLAFCLLSPSIVQAATIQVTGKAVIANSGNSYLDFSGYNSNVVIDNINGNFSGHVWLEDIGWVAFGTVDNPMGPVSVNLTTGVVSGKAYALNTGAYLDFTGYNSNVIVNIPTTAFSGYVWSEDVGWINFGDTGVSTLTNLDTTAPIPAIITKIGYISTVLDKPFLAYYYTSQTPVIQGTTEAGATVHFKNGPQDYTTTAGGDGKWSITLQTPDLPREKVTLAYYSEDAAGNVSASRTLVLIIGIENFPQAGSDATVTPTISSTPSVTPLITELPNTGETPIIPQIITLKVQDENGKALANATVTIDGQKYTSDAKGNIYLEGKPSVTSKVTIEYQGKIINGKVLGENLTLFTTGATPTNNNSNSNTVLIVVLSILVLGIIGAGGYLYLKKRN